MHWFRSHARLLSCLALWSLALQLALSFGHIHLKDVLGATHSATSTAAPAAVSVEDERHAAAPAADGDEHENQYCAIYAINALISSAQHCAAPSLLLPPPVGGGRLSIGYDFELAAFRHVLSQARAPPVA